MSHDNVFYFKLWWLFCVAEQNHFSRDRGSPKEYFCENILKSSHWPTKINAMSFKSFSIFSSGSHFVQPIGTISAILIAVTQDIDLWNYFEIRQLAYEKMLFKGFSIFRSGSHFVQWSKTVLAILVEGHPRNIPVELFWNQAIGLWDVVI